MRLVFHWAKAPQSCDRSSRRPASAALVRAEIASRSATSGLARTSASRIARHRACRSALLNPMPHLYHRYVRRKGLPSAELVRPGRPKIFHAQKFCRGAEEDFSESLSKPAARTNDRCRGPLGSDRRGPQHER